MPAERFVLLVDGPSRGEVVSAGDVSAILVTPGDAPAGSEPVTYQAQEWVILGHVVLIGLCGGSAEPDDLFGLLMSDAAKKCELHQAAPPPRRAPRRAFLGEKPCSNPGCECHD